ncbi:7-cyano-7-deazaguanine synthase [Priestia megaterium]|uniref:7-cyano-7-deazaguanine synthase n=1 Tax=Priestia megaterium TaxID=1404 RepID=UPI001BE61406|nr:7-cyano-7-deazaguanine synthase [Priestia megaterium]MBT2259800.1 7-cyano-7-deazaguanine synthase [Priestia megaterium]
MEKAVLLFSGGPDSTTLAYWIKEKGYDLNTLTFNFGEEEGEAEQRTAQYFTSELNVPHKFVSFEKVMRDFYMGDEDPIHILRKAGTNDAPIKAFGAGVAISLAASYAAEIGASHLFYAVHKDDTIFRENNKEFFQLISKAISIELGKEFTVHTPFLDKTKAEVLKIGHDFGIRLDETWSCATNSSIHCGSCAPCQDRKNAFKLNNLPDNTLYKELTSKNETLQLDTKA